jgi:hypothetical protein
MRKTSIAVLILFWASMLAVATPETVVVTYHPKQGGEAQLQKLIERQWQTLTDLQVVTGSHSLYRGDGLFVEVLTWKDASIPDNAPAPIRAIWADMGKLVEKRDCRQAIEIEEVHSLSE